MRAKIFQSPQPSRAVTPLRSSKRTPVQFQSPQPSRAVTDQLWWNLVAEQISIPTALAGCDLGLGLHGHLVPEFQSPQPSRAVTSSFDTASALAPFQSPQPSRAVTPDSRRQPTQWLISIPTALAGCDCVDLIHGVFHIISIPTALAGCDGDCRLGKRSVPISIPTALAGCDWACPS